MNKLKSPEILNMIQQYNTSWHAVFGPNDPSPYDKVIEYINQIENMNISLQKKLVELEDQLINQNG